MTVIKILAWVLDPLF